MANFGNNNFLGNQKRRNFIYNTAAQRPRDNRSLIAQPGTSTSCAQPRANTHRESPYKKFKGSHGLPEKREEQIAAEEAFRDIPLDAFDDEFDAIEDDFDDDDDLLTAEQLVECDRIASTKLQNPPDSRSNLPPRNENVGSFSKHPFSSSHVVQEEGLSDDDTKNTQDYSAPSSSRNHFSINNMAGFPVNTGNSRELRAPIITHPQESGSMEYAKSLSKSDSLLNSFVDQNNGPVSSHTAGANSVSKTNVHTTNNHVNNCPVTRHTEDAQMVESLRKDIEKLKAEFATASSKVKTLEEEKFCKDGEIKILRDSLEHYQADEKRKRAEEKAVQEQQAREQSQHEKELEKQVENLTTQIRFKEREISQMIEQNKKRTASLTEENNSSPKKKTVDLSKVFPTGSSFFQKTSPEAKAKSPRGTKLGSKDLKTQSKQNSPRLSEGENSENSVLSGTSSNLSNLERMKVQRRETDVSEREIMQLPVQSFPEVELVQNLLSPHEKELQSLLQDPENKTLNEGNIVSLLMLNVPSIYFPSSINKTTLSETNVSHTLRLFETQATSKLQRSTNSTNTVTQKDSLVSCDTTSVMQTLSGLLNHHQVDSDLNALPTQSNSKDHHLPTAVNFLPLLEKHLACYVEQRTETNDDNILSTCLPRGSPTQDLLEPKDSAGFESEHAQNLAVLQTTALTALRLLNILVFYSCEVCECILKSARAYVDSSEDDNDMETRDERTETSEVEDEGFTQDPLFPNLKVSIKKSPGESLHSSGAKKEKIDKTTGKEKGDSEDAVQQTELLGVLFKLLVPHQKESMTVVHTTLQVLTSLAKNCEVKFYPRMLPLLSDSLLSQCLAKDWSLSTLSLVTSLLTPLTRHNCILKRLCSRSDDCLLLKIYQGWIFRPDDVPATHYQHVHLQIVSLVNNLLKNSDSSMLLFPLESECHCSLELIKCLVLMLNTVLNSLVQVPLESLIKQAKDSQHLMLLRQGVFLLSTLCLNDRLFVEHRVDVEHQYINVVSSVTRLYKQIAGVISEAEVLAVQELVDFEHIEGIEWSQESEDEEDETVEGMDVAE